MAAATSTSRAVFTGTLVWLAAAVALGATGAFAALRPPAPQLVILALTLSAVFVTTRIASVRASIDGLSLRALVGVHVVRFIGAVFLIFAARGLLSPLFAARAGWGDILAASGALALVVVGTPVTPNRRWLYLAWNTFGALDLVVAVGTASLVVFRGDVPGMEPVLRLPLVIVPTFFVPLLFAGHVAIFRRLRKANAAP